MDWPANAPIPHAAGSRSPPSRAGVEGKAVIDPVKWAAALPRMIDMARNPTGWRIQDVEAFCTALGIKCEPPRGGGSHYKVSYPGKREILTIPFKRPIKPIYIRKLLAFAKSIQGAAE